MRLWTDFARDSPPPNNSTNERGIRKTSVKIPIRT
jgi:hypothetical protein